MTNHSSEVKRFSDGSSVFIEYSAATRREYWYDPEGLIHRDNGLPAILWDTGLKIYYEHGNKRTLL